jgi:hypothetical protein
MIMTYSPNRAMCSVTNPGLGDPQEIPKTFPQVPPLPCRYSIAGTFEQDTCSPPTARPRPAPGPALSRRSVEAALHRREIAARGSARFTLAGILLTPGIGTVVAADQRNRRPACRPSQVAAVRGEGCCVAAITIALWSMAAIIRHRPLPGHHETPSQPPVIRHSSSRSLRSCPMPSSGHELTDG